MPSTGTNFRWYMSDEIDASTTNATHLLSTTVNEPEYTRLFHPVGLAILLTEQDNVTVPATISVGTDAEYDDIAQAQLVGSLLGKLKLFNLAGDLAPISEATDIKVKVIAHATALLGTPVCKFKAIVFGFDVSF